MNTLRCPTRKSFEMSRTLQLTHEIESGVFFWNLCQMIPQCVSLRCQDIFTLIMTDTKEMTCSVKLVRPSCC